MPERDLTIEIEGRDRTGGLWRDTGRQASRFGDTLRSVGRIAGGVLAADAIREGLGALRSGFSSSVDAAVDLGESVNAVQRIFGDAADDVLDFGRTTANSLGLSERAFNQAVVPLGALLSNAGLEMDAVSDATLDLTERAADMASVFNTDVDQALQAITAGLRGETDPLEQFGVSINAAAVEARALADSGKGAASELDAMDLAAARVALIMEQTNDVAGDFSDTSDQLANSTRIARAEMEDQRAEIGERLLPVQQAWVDLQLEASTVLTDRLVPALDEASEWYGEHVAPAVERARDAGREWLDDQGGVEGVVARLGDVLSPVADGFEDMAESTSDAVDEIRPLVEEHGPELVRFFEEEFPTIQENVSSTLSAVGSGLSFLGVLVESQTAWIAMIWRNWGDEIGTVAGATWKGVTESSTSAMDSIAGILDAGTALLEGDWSAAWDSMEEVARGWGRSTIDIIRGTSGTTIVLWRGLTGGLDSAWSGAMGSISRAGDNMSATVARSVGGLSGTLLSRVPAIRGAAGALVDGAIGPFRGLPGRMARAGTAAWRALRSALVAGFAPILTAGRQLASAIARFLPGSPVETGPLTVLNRGYAGRQIVEMVASGIRDREGDLQNAVGRAVAPLGGDQGAPVAAVPAQRAGGDTIVIDLRGAVLPSDRGFEDLVVNALNRAGRSTRGRVGVRGRDL